MAVAFVFPGQGSQAVGMGKGLAESFAPARQVFEEVDAALGERLSEMIWNGPAETLTLTQNAQPALMAVSLAAMRVLEAEAGVNLARDAAFVAGHSLGEYSALAAAQSLSIADAARLLRIRGRAMQKAVPVGAGAMAALIGLDYGTAKVVAAEAAGADVCAAANDNGGEQVVLSGDKAAVERAVEIAKTRGAKRAMLLPVSAPFHCALMQPAADAMAEALANVAVKPPSVPLVANVLAQPISNPADIVRSLVEQVTGTVRWRELVLFMAQAGVTTFYEIGAGKVLTGLIKRIAPGANASAIGTPDDVTKFKAIAERLKRTRCSISPEKPPWSRERPAPSAAASRAPFMRRARRVAISGTRVDALDALAGELGGRVHVLPCNLADAAAVDALVASAEEAMGQLDVLVANAGVTRDNLLVQLRDEDWEAGDRHQPHRHLPPDAGRRARHDAAALRPHHRDHVGGRDHRQSGAGELRRRQSRHRRHDQGHRPGICQARRHRELRRARVHRHADDRQAQRQATRRHPGKGSGQPGRHARGSRRGGRLSRLERGRLCHRTDVACERRNGDDLKGIGLFPVSIRNAGQRK